MCGFFGGYFKNIDGEYLNDITISLKRRGSDDYNYFIDENSDLSLAFRRLSIIDLSSNGSQPMLSNSGRYILVFNGEIYNHLDLLNKYNLNRLYNFKSRSDTEVILACIEILGINKTLQILDGMYAICIFDNKTKQLYLVTDYFSQKPIYYYYDEKKFFFSSDLSTFKKLNLNLSINQKSKKIYFETGFIPAPNTIWNNCFKLRSNSLLIYDKNSNSMNEKSEVKNFFKNQNKKFSLKELDLHLEKSVAQTMISDVDIGCFLSSGIDSSLVASYISKHSKKKINTFSVGFQDSEYSELNKVSEISNYLDTEHRELLLTYRDVISFLEQSNSIYSEPFADSSQIPTFFLSQFASKYIKVALTGDGADELFCGYNRHIYTHYLHNVIKILPTDLLYKLFYNTNLFNSYINYENKDKVNNILKSRNILDLYATFIGHSDLFRHDLLDYLKLLLQGNKNDLLQIIEFDKKCYLPYDILVKTDRASMYSSLECRTPYLNNEIISISESINSNKNFSFFKGKNYLRKLLKQKIPIKLINKKKQGFAIPLSKWFKTDLSNYLDNFNLKHNEFINYSLDSNNIFKKRLNEHRTNKRNWSKFIWNTVIYVNFFKNG